MLHQPVDIIMSHDWPFGVVKYGDEAEIRRKKPYLSKDLDLGEVGCREYVDLMRTLTPRFWLAGHMHIRFEANVPVGENQVTKFLALSKVMRNEPYHEYIQVLSFPNAQGRKVLEYDEEWLGVLRYEENRVKRQLGDRWPARARDEYPRVAAEIDWVKKNWKTTEGGENRCVVPENFVMTTVPHLTGETEEYSVPTHPEKFSPQTQAFMQQIGISSPDTAITPSHADFPHNNQRSNFSRNTRQRRERGGRNRRV